MTDMINDTPLAPEHWSVEKKRREWDNELKEFRQKQRSRLTHIRIKSKKKVAELHERIFFVVRWANPRLPSTYRKLVFEYCDHLMGAMPESEWPKWNVLLAWQAKFEHGPEAKVTLEIQTLLQRLSRLVLKRDEALVKTLVQLDETTEKMAIKKEGTLRWQMETIKCKRDEYWTIWYLSMRGKADELVRYLKTHDNVDERDPDYGMTALHYACKHNHMDVMKILLEAGANERSRIEEDGRTPLHLAAAYGTREMVLELLAVGAEYEAVDNYGSTALDLATQNKNHPVVSTLSNWVHLVPHKEETPRPEEDLSAVPEEYMSTPYEVLITMSPSLRVVTTRLEGTGQTHSFGSGMEIGLELRLCEKRADMCIAEGFHAEALKSKRRRWTAAKRAFTEQRKPKPALQGVYNSVVVAGKSDDSVKTTKLGTSFVYSVCNDLAEFLIADRQYAPAEVVISDGLTILYDLDDNLRISLLKRYCQLLLFLADRNSTSAGPLDSDMGAGSTFGELYGSTACTTGGDMANAASIFSSRDIEMTEEEATAYIASMSNSAVVGTMDADVSPSLAATVPLPPIYAGKRNIIDNNVSHMGEGSIHMKDMVSTAPVLRGQSQTDGTPTATGVQEQVDSQCYGNGARRENSLPLITPHASIFTQPDNAFQVTASVYSTLPSYQQYLVRVDNCVREAIDLVKSQYSEAFLEPPSLAPLLEIASESADRQGKYEEALALMDHTATVKERTLGQADPETVHSMIECLRLTIRKNLVIANTNKQARARKREIELSKMNKYARAKVKDVKEIGVDPTDKKNFSLVGLQATEVSRRLDRLTQTNPEAATRLSGKCYKLVALTDLIVAGDIDPTNILSSKSNKVGGNRVTFNTGADAVPHVSALDISAYGESKIRVVKP